MSTLTQAKIKVIAYLRVSTDKQVKEGEGLEIQRERISDFCERNNYICVAVFSDEGISGAKETTDRPGIVEMLDYCKTDSSVHFLVVDKVDRLSRDLFQQLFIEKELLLSNVKILYAAQETLNGDNVVNDAMRKMMGVFAEMERKLINQRLADGMKKKADNGNKPSGRQPFGYEYSYDRKTTAINEFEAKTVRCIFNIRAGGVSLNRIASYLNMTTQGDGYNDNNKNRVWTNQSVRVILTNDYYIGKITHAGKKIDGNHQPIISMNV
jgi:site-specific DNA recombinase